jgi:hypothetical protein
VKAVISRLRKLERRFGFTVAAPSVDEAIIERLVAGEWQSALKLLAEPQEQDVWQEQQSMGRSDRGPTGRIGFALTGLTRLRQTLSVSLADLPAELRFDIAQRLLAADIIEEVEGRQIKAW